MKRKMVWYMPDFDFSYLKIRDHMFSIPSLRVKKKYVIHLLESLNRIYEEYVIGTPYYPLMGEKYLKTIFHEGNKIFPYKKGVQVYEIHNQLNSLNRWVDQWVEFQKRYDLTDDEMFQSALVYEEDIPETLLSDKTMTVLKYPCWRDHNRSVLIKALNHLFENYAELENRKINIRVNSGKITDTDLHKQALGYFLWRLSPHVNIKMNFFVQEYILINGEKPRSYNVLTKKNTTVSKGVIKMIDSIFTINDLVS
ncbi:MAG: hypothetical protein HQ557_15460 [Bacteroidetes bacterium]|nr:hypothetical protein [Bacteroidota bacterium]